MVSSGPFRPPTFLAFILCGYGIQGYKGCTIIVSEGFVMNVWDIRKFIAVVKKRYVSMKQNGIRLLRLANFMINK